MWSCSFMNKPNILQVKICLRVQLMLIDLLPFARFFCNRKINSVFCALRIYCPGEKGYKH